MFGGQTAKNLRRSISEKSPTSHHTPRILEGGDFTKAKTSNTELDGIFENYLLTGMVLPYDSLPRLTRAKTKALETKLVKGRLASGSRYIIFPLFIRNHWTTGVLRSNLAGQKNNPNHL